MEKENRPKYFYKKLANGEVVKIKKRFKIKEEVKKEVVKTRNYTPATSISLAELQKHFNGK